MIGDLEREWNVSLLERNIGGVRLTSDGMKLLPYAKSVVAEFEKMQLEIDELNGLQSGLRSEVKNSFSCDKAFFGLFTIPMRPIFHKK